MHRSAPISISLDAALDTRREVSGDARNAAAAVSSLDARGSPFSTVPTLIGMSSALITRCSGGTDDKSLLSTSKNERIFVLSLSKTYGVVVSDITKAIARPSESGFVNISVNLPVLFCDLEVNPWLTPYLERADGVRARPFALDAGMTTTSPAWTLVGSLIFS